MASSFGATCLQEDGLEHEHEQNFEQGQEVTFAGTGEALVICVVGAADLESASSLVEAWHKLCNACSYFGRFLLYSPPEAVIATEASVTGQREERHSHGRDHELMRWAFLKAVEVFRHLVSQRERERVRVFFFH